MSLSMRLVIPLASMMTICFIALSAYIHSYVNSTTSKQLADGLTQYMDFVQKASSPAVLSLDEDTLNLFVEEAKKSSEVVNMAFYDEEGGLLSGDLSKEFDNPYWHFVERDIISHEDGETKIGSLGLIYTSEPVEKALNSLAYQMALAFIGVLLLQGLALLFLVNKASGKLENSATKLVTVADRMTSTGSELSRTSDQLSSMSTEQAAAIQETVASLNEITEMVGRTVTHAETSSSASHQSYLVSMEADQTVTSMRSSMQSIQDDINEFNEKIQDSNKQISAIAGIIEDIIAKTRVIDDIVFQTKLLSFNASVEAARASEHGRGFAVVAQEVGNLAAMSGQSAKEISDQLKSSHDQVENIISSTSQTMAALIEKSSKRVEEGVGQADQCQAVLQQVVTQASEVKRMMDEVALASKEQADGIQNINTAMGELDSSTQSQAKIAFDTAAISNKVYEQGQGIREAVNSLEQEISGSKNEENIGKTPNSNTRTGKTNVTQIKTEQLRNKPKSSKKPMAS